MKTRRDILPQIEGAVFRVITDADWARELRAARARSNAISARIQKILASSQGEVVKVTSDMETHNHG